MEETSSEFCRTHSLSIDGDDGTCRRRVLRLSIDGDDGVMVASVATASKPLSPLIPPPPIKFIIASSIARTISAFCRTHSLSMDGCALTTDACMLATDLLEDD